MKNENCEYCDGAVEQAVKRVRFQYKKETIYVITFQFAFVEDA
jgi:hypothetical protein